MARNEVLQWSDSVKAKKGQKGIAAPQGSTPLLAIANGSDDDSSSSHSESGETEK